MPNCRHPLLLVYSILSLLHNHRIILHLIFQTRNQALDDRHRSLQGLATIEMNGYLRVLITLGKEGELLSLIPHLQKCNMTSLSISIFFGLSFMRAKITQINELAIFFG